MVIRGIEGRQPSSLLAGRLRASLEDSDWLEFLIKGLFSFRIWGPEAEQVGVLMGARKVEVLAREVSILEEGG